VTDVPTTPRKPLTPRQRLALYEAHGGKCVLCGTKIMPGEKFIDEHIRPLALGGSNDLSNRGPAHERCAAEKTHGPTGDLARAAKAKRQKRAALGIKAQTKKIESAPFVPAPKQAKATKPLAKPSLNPRAMFRDV
jgi:5-methylcytosine-specific restriction protein A